jgi:hypothetical protein
LTVKNKLFLTKDLHISIIFRTFVTENIKDMIVENFICFECEHWNSNNPDGLDTGCRAFPNGIPQKYPQENEHKQPFEEQKGDYVFKKVKPENKGKWW